MKTLLKDKRILLKISNAYDREDRKRNIVLTVTMAFSIMSLFLLLSMVSGRVKADDIKRIRENGSTAAVIFENVSEEQYQNLAELSYVQETGISRNFGIWYQDNKKAAACSIVSEEDFEKMYLPAFDHVAGKYPENSNEIMLSARIISSLGIEEPEIGMEIPVHIVLHDWFRKGTEDIDTIFRLAGYYTDYVEDLEKLPKAFFSEEFAREQKISCFINDALIKTDKLWMNAAQAEKQFYSDIILKDGQRISVINEGLSKTLQSMMGSCVLAFLGILLIIFSMNLFIYNIFSISVNRKIREYGLLKVIGTEPRQIRGIFIFSGLKVMLSGGVLGILSGSLSVEFILPELLEKMYLEGNGNLGRAGLYSGKLMMASVILSAIGAAFAFGDCIRSVVRLSPIDCSKYEEKTYVFQKRNMALKGTGIAGIAWRNFTRNRKKMYITTGSLFVGIEVCLLAVLISRGLDQTNRICQEPDFEVGVTKEAVEYFLSLNEGNDLEGITGHQLMPEELVSEIISRTGINSDGIEKCAGGFGTFSYKSEAIKPRIDSWQYGLEIITGLTVQAVTEDWIEELEAYARKKGYGIDVSNLKAGNGFLLLHGHELSPGQMENADRVVGEKLSGVLFEEGGKAFELLCCGYLDFSENGFPKLNMPWEGKNLNYIVISEKTMESLGMKPVVYNISFDVGEGDEQEIKNIIQGILRDANQSQEFTNTYYLKAASDLLAKEQNYILAVRAAMGGFSGILMLFAFAGFYDTLLTGYISRSREFMIMRNIGMTMKELRKMLIYEGIFYWVSVLALVLAPGSGILLAVAKIIRGQVPYFTFRYPVSCAFCTLAAMLLAIVFLPLFLYSNGKRRLTD